MRDTVIVPPFLSQEAPGEKMRRSYAREGAIVGGLGSAAALSYWFIRNGGCLGDLKGGQCVLVATVSVAGVGALGALTGALFGSMFPKALRARSDSTARVRLR